MTNNNALINWIKNGISDGILSENEKLPTEPELSKKFGITLYAVRKALETLEAEGVLYKIQGSGSYVSKEMAGASVKKSGKTSNTIGMVLKNSNSYIFPEVVCGISEELSKNGYPLSLHITDNDFFSESDAIERLMEQNPAGIIIEPSCSMIAPFNDSLYEDLSKEIPVLLIHSVKKANVTCLDLRDEEGAGMLIRYLLAKGHEKIGTIFCMDEQTGSARYLGTLKELKKNNIPRCDECELWFKRNSVEELFREGGQRMLERMLNQVSAVFCHDDRLAYELIYYLEKTGRRVPEDISVVGYDGVVVAGAHTKVTTIAHPKSEYGRNAARAIIKMIEKPDDFDISDYETGPEFIEGETVKDISK